MTPQSNYQKVFEEFGMKLKSTLVSAGVEEKSKDLSDVIALAQIRCLQELIRLHFNADLEQNQGKKLIPIVLKTISEIQAQMSERDKVLIDKSITMVMQDITSSIFFELGKDLNKDQKQKLMGTFLTKS